MANALYTTKTLTNQALTARSWGNRITLPVLLPVLLITLFILSACGGGGAAPTTATPTPPANPCATNPFGDTCMSEADALARDVIIRRCIMVGNADNDNCKNAIAKNPCIATPFIPECSSRNSTFAVYVDTAQTERRNFCEIKTNATHRLCVTSIANICKIDIFDDFCPDPTDAEEEAFCRMGTNAMDVSGCAAVVQRICTGTQDLFERLCPPDTIAQQRHCRMDTNAVDVPDCTAVVTGICTNNPFDGICAGMFLVNDDKRAEFCRTGNNLITFADNCTQIATNICDTTLFDPICKDRVADQLQACNGDPADLSNVGAVATDCIQYVDGICGYGRVGGSNPFAPICTDKDISKYSTAITSVRVAFCQANIFHASCDTGYITERVAACHLNGVPTDTDPRCPTIIADNCPSSGTRNAACHTVVTVTEASITDPITNYVAGTADAPELELGFNQSAPPASISDFSKGTIQLSDLTAVTSGGDADGVGFASFTNSAFFTTAELATIAGIGYQGTQTNGNTTTTISRLQDGLKRTEVITVSDSGRTIKRETVTRFGRTEYSTIEETLDGGTKISNFRPPQRFYAGVLAGNTLAADPLSENLKNAKWPAKIAIYNEVNLLCLGKELTLACRPTGSTNGATTTTAEFTLLVSFDGTTGSIRADGIPVVEDYRFAIDARFNDAGNIYGNTRLSVVRNSTKGPSTFLLLASDGSITGLIGQKGLIAAFVSDGVNNRLGEYAGGLVAYNSLNPSGDVAAPDDCTATGTPFDARCADNDALRIMLCSTRHATAMADFAENCTDDSDVTDAVCAVSGTYANPFDGVICANPQPLVQQAFVDNCSNTNVSLRGATCTAVTACITNPFEDDCNTGDTAEVYDSARVAHLEYCNNAPVVSSSGCELAVQNCASGTPHADCGDLATTYCIGEAGRTITGDTSNCGARVTTRCLTNPLSPLCADDTINTGFTGNDRDAVLKDRRETFCEMPINANNPDCAVTIAVYCDAADNTQIFEPVCRNRVNFRYNVIASVCHDSNRDTALDNLCNNPHAYDIQRLEHCETVDFKLAGCGVTISEERQAMLEIICGHPADELRGTNPNDPICDDHAPSHHTNLNTCGGYDRAGTNPKSPICEIEPQVLITVAALCGQGFKDGTIGTIGINPFSDVCASELFNPVPCPTCASIADATERATKMTEVRDNAWKVAKENFCREGFRAITRAAIAGDTTPVYTASTDCAPIITAFCPATPSADLFDDLCNGTAYAANRTSHCGTSGFTHAKCGASQTNIDKAAVICGTEAVPGTNPFDEVCRDKTLSPDITLTSLVATQRTFCRASANVGEPICDDTIANFCNVPISSDVIFDDLCGGADYTGARLAYCIHPTRSVNEECETDANNKIALMALCGDADTTGTNPFSVACTTASLLRLEIDALCGGGRNSQLPLCTKENAIPAIDRASITASQENFCRGNLALPACEETIADFCDFAIGTNVLDPLCSGNEYYQETRLTTCLIDDVNNENCRGAAGIVATLCPTTAGMPRHELCPAIVDHDLYTTPVNEFDGSTRIGSVSSLTAAGVVSKISRTHFATNVDRAIGFATDAPATLITARYDGYNGSGLDFGTLPTDLTEIRNGGAPVQISVTINSNTVYRIPNTEDGYVLAVAAVSTQAPGRYTTENKLYAGVLSKSRTLGAPNFDNPPTGIWNASMNLLMNGGNAKARANFDLKVNFISQRISTLTNGFAQFILEGPGLNEPQSNPITGRLTVDADFSRAGLIYGATNLETGFFMPSTGDFTGENGGATLNSAGRLVGWIGNKKLVGAFASNAGSAEAYVGGFTATPSTTPSPTSFTAGGTDKLTLTGIAEAADATSAGWTSNEDYVIDGTTNGFALASVNVDNGNGGFERDLYAGILSGTNLGNPLFDNSVTGVWNASMNLLMRGGTATADFALNVDFNRKTIETLANSPVQFTLTGVDFNVAKIDTSDSPLAPLLHPTEVSGGNPVPLYVQNSLGTDRTVLPGEEYTDCSGNLVPNYFVIPICTGGGRIAYILENGKAVLDANGDPTFETVAISAPTGRFTVNGRFSSTGKITGTTNIKIVEPTTSVPLSDSAGTLTGLIGENGLVAAFISDAGSPDTYAGGFTATAGDCTIGGTLFVKTSCPDTNIIARDLRLRLCAERHPVAMADFAANCTGDATVTNAVCTGSGTYANPFDTEFCPTSNSQSKTAFIGNCLTNPAQALACENKAVRDCLADPYDADANCIADYTSAQPSHWAKCGTAETEGRQDPTCKNFRTFLAGCAVASPNVACGQVVNTYCFAGARRTTGGAVTCGSLITSACNANPFSSVRCTGSGIGNDRTYATIRLEACSGDLTYFNNLITSQSACNTPELAGTICGTSTSVGLNPYAPICNDSRSNPYFEQLEAAKIAYCREGPVADLNANCIVPRNTPDDWRVLGTTANWRVNAFREVATPVLNDDGSFKTKDSLGDGGSRIPKTITVNGVQRTAYLQDPITKLVRFPINITPAGKVRQDNAAANYIVGGTTALDLGGAPNPDPELDKERNPIPSTVVTNTPTSIANLGGFKLSDLDNTKDAGSGFAFASATFPVRELVVKLPDNSESVKPRGSTIARTVTRTYGGTKLYTGLLAGTNVGAPLSDFQTEVEWKGKIDGLYGVGDTDTGVRNTMIDSYTDKEFTLLVSFYGNFGSIKNKSRIVLGSHVFDIDGRFTDRGLIYGDTKLFRGGELIASGSLTGLIGAEGAVATFVSDDENPANGGACCTSNFGNYVGGFVALPPATPSTDARADFAAWLASFQAPNIPLTSAIRTEDFTSENDKQYFIQGTVSALNRANENYGNEKGTFNPKTLTLDHAFNDGNIYDGIAYLRGTHKRAYAGILLGTDLGAPLADEAGTTVKWAGRFRDTFHSSSNVPDTSGKFGTPFELTVRFAAQGGTLDGIVSRANNTLGVGIDGAFDTKGIITGDVIYGNIATGNCVTSGLPTVTEGCFTNDTNRRKATLTGLIGEQGAVAAFTGQRGSFPSIFGWVGGFVATPDFCGNTPGTAGNPDCNTNRADWVGSFGSNAPPATIAASTAGTNVFGGFLDIATGITIAAEGLKTMPNGAIPASSSFIDRTRAGQDGYIFISGYNGANHQAFVGLRPTTNMGAPLTVRPAFAEWTGQYYNSETGQQPVINFNINFDEKSITASHTTSDSPSITTAFDLGFDLSGVITGMVSRSGIDATARGLIGTEGLIGVFVDTSPPTSGTVLFGGFVATNPSP